MDIINKLQPKQYEFRSDGAFKAINFPRGTHYGLIAQDVEKVLPNLVKTTHLKVPVILKEDSKDRPQLKTEISDFKALNYMELIPILIKGMQELSQQNTDLKNQVAQLKQAVGQNSSSSNASLSSATLGQNFPNPFSQSTTISFSIPKETSTANIVVSQTGTGKVIKSISVSGSSQLSFDASSLSAGAYTYTLYIDGKKIDSKQMIINK